jgi:hypothetical protein
MVIDAKSLIGVKLSDDGARLHLRVLDETGRTVSLFLPVCWLNEMLSAVPGLGSAADTVHPLDSWSMERVGTGQDLVLTLRTPEGQAISFIMKPWQVEGMATIATYGGSGRTSDDTIH